jgi:hypothetical protein
MGKKTNEGKVQKAIRFDRWMADAIQEIAENCGLTFTAIVIEFLREELAAMGYTMGIGREAIKVKTETKRAAKSKTA